MNALKDLRRRNDGRQFEEEVVLACRSYQAARVASIEKVEPPVRVMGGGANVIFLRNPFLDFVGAWTAQGARAIFFEAKSTARPQLQFDKGHLSESQISSLARWSRSGAASFLIWRCASETKLFTAGMVINAEAALRGPRHLYFGDGMNVGVGPDFHLDFLSVYAAATAW